MGPADDSRAFFHRASAAFCAASRLSAGVILSDLARPPFNPPRRPRAAAAALMGSTGSSGCLGKVPVSSPTIWKARELKSRGRLGSLTGWFGLLVRSGML